MKCGYPRSKTDTQIWRFIEVISDLLVFIQAFVTLKISFKDYVHLFFLNKCIPVNIIILKNTIF